MAVGTTGQAASIGVFDGAPAQSEALQARLEQRGLRAERFDLVSRWAQPVLPIMDLAIVVVEDGFVQTHTGPLHDFAARLIAADVPTVIWGPSAVGRFGGLKLLEFLDGRVGVDEVVGRIATLVSYAPLVARMERELTHLHRLGQQLNRYFSEVDQELRLAGRLQRDFLPARLPHVPPLRFAALYRPASWVSGDLYDVFRIDETRLGFFVADAMGHGLAAGLLTMFLRQALVPKQIDPGGYRVLPPHEALRALNESLVQQRLPHQQFITAVYGVIDTQTMEVAVARGGHPYPIHLSADGSMCELQSSGSLLGLADLPPDFTEVRATLRPGDKLIAYSDGIESLLLNPGASKGDKPKLSPLLAEWRELSADELVGVLAELLDREEGSLHPADDVTVVVVEHARG